MKQTFSSIIVLMFSITVFFNNAYSQNTETNDEDQYQSHSEEIVEVAMEREILIDTLILHSGKPIVFIIDIEKNSYGSYILSTSYEKEKFELSNNFSKDAFEIVVITTDTYVQSDNKKILNANCIDESYQAFAYWSGKLGDEVKVREGGHFATEFVAEQMGVKKESSYVINTRLYKAEVASLQNKNNITENSKIVMNAYLRDISSGWPGTNEVMYANLFHKQIVKLKTIDTYLNNNGTKITLNKVSLNGNGQPSLIKSYSMDGENERLIQYVYENGMLSKIMYSEEYIVIVKYDNDKMIMLEKGSDKNEMKVFSVVNNILVYKTIILMNDDIHPYENWCVEERFENNCKFRYVDNIFTKQECISQIGIFPYTYEYSSFYNSKRTQYEKYKIEKKDDKTFEMYYFKSDPEGQKDDYKLRTTFRLNEKYLVSTCTFIKNNETYIIKMDYTYYE